jgi:hypothetical protein
MSQPSGMRQSAPTFGITLLAIAGLLFIIGAFVPAASVEIQGRSESAALWDGWEGKAALIVGILVLLAAAWALLTSMDVRGAGVAIFALGLAAMIMAIYKIASIESEAVNDLAAAAAARQNVPVEAAKGTIQRLFDAGVASVDVTIGLWMVVAAGILTVLGGIVLALTRPLERMVTRERMEARIR